MKVYNVENIIDEEDVGLCTICDQPIFNYEEVSIARVGQVQSLAHEICCQDAELLN